MSVSPGVKQVAIILVLSCTAVGCNIGPTYSPALQPEDSGLNVRDKAVVVTRFYRAKTELSYLGSQRISEILEAARLRDISFDVARHLGSEGVRAVAKKDADVNSLAAGQVMLSGAIVTRSIAIEENFPFPGMMVVILIGNILPSPAPYQTGVEVVYRYELVDASGRILFASPEKKSRIYYKHYYIWGTFSRKRHEAEINEKLDKEICDLVIADLFR